MGDSESLAKMMLGACSLGYYKHLFSPKYGAIQFPRLIFTKAISILFAEFPWLLEAISWSQAECMRDPDLKDEQFWLVRPTDHGTSILSCERDEDDIAFSLEVNKEFTLPLMEIWVERATLAGKEKVMVGMLPIEFQGEDDREDDDEEEVDNQDYDWDEDCDWEDEDEDGYYEDDDDYDWDEDWEDEEDEDESEEDSQDGYYDDEDF